jgi:hypothetical protein
LLDKWPTFIVTTQMQATWRQVLFCSLLQFLEQYSLTEGSLTHAR